MYMYTQEQPYSTYRLNMRRMHAARPASASAPPRAACACTGCMPNREPSGTRDLAACRLPAPAGACRRLPEPARACRRLPPPAIAAAACRWVPAMAPAAAEAARPEMKAGSTSLPGAEGKRGEPHGRPWKGARAAPRAGWQGEVASRSRYWPPRKESTSCHASRFTSRFIATNAPWRKGLRAGSQRGNRRAWSVAQEGRAMWGSPRGWRAAGSSGGQRTASSAHRARSAKAPAGSSEQERRGQRRHLWGGCHSWLLARTLHS